MKRPVALFLLAAALALVPLRSGWGAGVADHAATQAVVISGHRGAVLAIDHDDSRGLLFTAGADGAVRIWNASTRSLVKSLTVTSLQAGMLAVSPADTKFAVLSMDALQSFSLEVWDWRTGEQLFKIPLTDQPLFLRYSASGRYILYGLPRWESLRIVNASDGSPVAFHPEGFGMVGFAALSRSEKILMTYRLTGTISYWDLDSGRLLEDLHSVPLLSHIRLTPDLGSIIGSTDSELCLIDVASGRLQDRASLSAVTSLDVSPAGDQIACIAESGTLSRWSLSQGAMTRTAAPPSPPPDASVVRYVSGALVLGSGSGELTSLTADGGTSRFPTDERALVTGMAVRGDAIALASSSWIKAFTTGLPDAARPGGATAESIGTLQIDNPFKVPTDLTFLDDDSLLVWTTGDGPGTYGVLDLRTGGFRSVGSPAQPLAAPVIEAVSDGSRCLILAKDGTLRIIDLASGVTRAQMWRPGAMWATLIAGNTVVVGGQPGDTVPGSLVKITMETGETDPIPTTNRYTYDVIYDTRTSTLYSLGVDADGSTNLLANTGPDFQVQSVVESTPGEHLFATLCFDEPTGALYTTLGREQISQWKQGSLQKLPASARGAIALYCSGGLLYALNRDSSVSLVDTSHGQSAAELSVFPEGGWALIMSDGKFAASAGALSHVAVLQDGKLVRDSSSYLIPLRVAEGR